MSFFDPENVKTVLAGRWLTRPARSAQQALIGIGTDTRDDLANRAFVAIRGENHDGHSFLQQALSAGARLLIVDDASKAQGLSGEAGVLQVKDTRQALARMALAYRRTLRGCKVIAVTGSAGKTTTKRLIHGVLSVTMRGTASPKSFNNDIGVPLTILAGQPSDKFMVVEVGSSAPGEIARLASIVEPDLAVITSIGRAHLQGLGGLEGIAREKASLIDHIASDGVLIANADALSLKPHLRRAPACILFGQSAHADLRLTGRGPDESIWWFEVNGRDRFPLRLPGRHNAINALAAVAIARRLGMDCDAIAAGLASVKPEAMRMETARIGGVTIVNDAYNANPESMAASLEAFLELSAACARRIIILGDMLELGAEGPSLHRELAVRVLQAGALTGEDHLYLVGPLCAQAARETGAATTRNLIAAPNVNDDLVRAIVSAVQPGDAVLVKGSRGMKLERIASALVKRLLEAHPASPAAVAPPAPAAPSASAAVR